MFFVSSCEKTHDPISSIDLRDAAKIGSGAAIDFASYEKNLRSETQKRDVEIANGIVHFRFS
jgi:hypothetical protein